MNIFFVQKQQNNTDNDGKYIEIQWHILIRKLSYFSVIFWRSATAIKKIELIDL